MICLSRSHKYRDIHIYVRLHEQEGKKMSELRSSSIFHRISSSLTMHRALVHTFHTSTICMHLNAYVYKFCYMAFFLLQSSGLVVCLVLCRQMAKTKQRKKRTHMSKSTLIA